MEEEKDIRKKKIKDFSIGDLINFCKENKKTILNYLFVIAIGSIILILILNS
jgi:sporulation protein YlmC with PRC-barrel domain